MLLTSELPLLVAAPLAGLLARSSRLLPAAAVSIGLAPAAFAAAPVPQEVRLALERGESATIIVLLEDQDIQAEALFLRRAMGEALEGPQVLALRAARYAARKKLLRDALPAAEHEVLAELDHLPLTVLRVRSARALERLAAQGSVRALYPDARKFPVLDAQSLDLIQQPAAAAAGATGSGATVLVIDTGVNYTLAEFGSCTSPGVPAGCRVVVNQNLAGSGTAPDAHGHGTNVSGIVAGVAPGAKIASMNVFGSNTYTTDSLILQAINWGIANRAAYNIRALNMSLGDGVRYTSPCSSAASNPYLAAIANAWAAGIVPVAAAGNEAYTNGLSNPACTPGVVSVGAVYSGNFGGLAWSACADSSTAADKVTCFSNSASFLTLLAPGALITAGGYTYGGTSQASPFVAAAAAVLAVAYPGEGVDGTVTRLTSTGFSVTDARNGIVKPRLGLGAAIRPANDNFAARAALSGSAGQAGAVNTYASGEAGEAAHAGTAPRASVWWKWTAPGAGQASIDTHGSGFDTVLGVYTGSTLATLVPVKENNDDGAAGGASGVLFQAVAGTGYAIAVDSAAAAAGSVVLNWSLNSAAAADLSITVAPPAAVTWPEPGRFDLTVGNGGPQAATGVRLQVLLGEGGSFGQIPAACAADGPALSCELGDLPAGGGISLQVAGLAAAPGILPASFSLGADLPDPVSADNTATASVSIAAGAGAEEADVPLPAWAAALLAAGLLGALVRRVS